MKNGLGLQMQASDIADFAFTPKLGASAMPSATNNRQHIGRIEQQGLSNSCTGHAFSTAIEFLIRKNDKVFVEVSRLFPYYNARVLEGNTATDCGATIRSVFKAANKVGYCSEIRWPFCANTITQKPWESAYMEAQKTKLKSYEAVEPTTLGIRQALASGFVVVGGMAVYGSMQSKRVAKSGIVPMPTAKDPLNGYHAIVFCDYDDKKMAFLCVNSWGEEWGQKGFFWLPYRYKEVFDCWVPKIV